MPKFVFLLLFVLLFFKLSVSPVAATPSACSAGVSPTSVSTSTSTSLSFSVSFEGDEGTNIIWARFTAPSADFTITGGSASDWTSSYDSSTITFEGGSFTLGSTANFTVNITTGASAVGASSFTLDISDSQGGGNPVQCSSSGVSIINLNISDVTVSEVGNSSVKIGWTTSSAADSRVDYGTTNAYGSNTTDTASGTSHSLSVTGLSANTTYHYKVKSTDADGNSVESGDNTFTTAQSSTTTTTTTTTTVTRTVDRLVTPTPTPTPLPDRTPPTVVLSSAVNFSKPFKKAPLITGSASDNKDVSRVDYSTDDGKNWLPVEKVRNTGGRFVTFEFTPNIAEDGNYKVKVRARDSMVNIGVSKGVVLVIDRLPPEVGGNIFSVGPQILVPDKNGLVFSLAGISQKITLSAVGGPISIEIDTDQKGKSFSMTKNSDNGLWSAVLNFESPGVIGLTAKSIDGAGNITERQINKIVVEESGKVADPKGQPIKDAQISIYHFDSLTQRFFLWDGKSYGQNNPQKTNKEGKYGLFIPPGKYYMYIKAGGFKPVRTDIFTINETSPINAKFVLNYQEYIGFGSFRLPFYSFKQDTVKFKPTSPEIPEEALIEDELSGRSERKRIKNQEFPQGD